MGGVKTSPPTWNIYKLKFMPKQLRYLLKLKILKTESLTAVKIGSTTLYL